MIIAIANQKGGVGKTTTNISLCAWLAKLGKKVLTIDLDPQGNTTIGLGFDKSSMPLTIYNMLLNDCSISDVLQQTCVENLHILPTDVQLSKAEIELFSYPDRDFILKKALAPIKSNYDFILIDCPPSLSALTINALTAADSVLVPVQCEYFALDGLNQLLCTVELIKEKLNPQLYIEMVVLTMYNQRLKMSAAIFEQVKNLVDENTPIKTIPRNSKLSEAAGIGVPITLHDKRSKGAQGYLVIAELIIENNKDLDKQELEQDIEQFSETDDYEWTV